MSSNAVQSSLGSSSGYSIGSDASWDVQSIEDNSSDRLSAVGLTGSLADGAGFTGTYAVTRFGVRDGRIVAYGRLLPSSHSELNAGVTGAVISTGGALLSSPLEPAGGYGSDPMLGYGSRIHIEGLDLRASSDSRSTSIGTVSSVDDVFDASRLGSWTGISDGYGESGVESRSRIVGSSRAVGTSYYQLSRSSVDDAHRGTYLYDGENDVWYLGTAPGVIEYEVGSSDLEADYYMERDGSSSDIRVTSPSVSITRPTLALSSRSVPLVQLGGSSTLYASREAQRAAIVTTSEHVIVPVSVVDASCDRVTLSFGPSSTRELSLDGQTITLTSSSGSDAERVRGTLCDVAAATSSDNTNAALLKQLNRLVSSAQ